VVSRAPGNGKGLQRQRAAKAALFSTMHEA
jgi:hypothetical protein